MSRSLKALINTAAITYNLQRVREIAPSSRIIAMIKANGYGHGLITVAKALNQADAFGVAVIEEAIQLRQAGIKNRIVLMEGFFSASELPTIAQLQLEPVLHHDFQLDILKHYTDKQINCWLKIDTGMHRLGFIPSSILEVINKIRNLKFLKLVGIMTHFACAEDIDNDVTNQQIACFKQVINYLPEQFATSLANSAAILSWPTAHGDWVRPGIMLYGISPFTNLSAQHFALAPAMTLCTELIAIKQVAKGQAIGYGGRYICSEDMLVGVIAIGYGDGYPRSAPDGTPVLVKGHKTNIIGQVAMDMVTIDLRPIVQPRVGDPVILWGDNLAIETIAKYNNTVPHALLANLGRRITWQTVTNEVYSNA